MAQGGVGLLAMAAGNVEDPQTLCMAAGVIANLCGNDKLHLRLRSEGGIEALLGMVRSRHPDVLSQVARGISNFANCKIRASIHGSKSGRSLLIEDGALPWIVQNANNEASLIRRHIELALCHLTQHEANQELIMAQVGVSLLAMAAGNVEDPQTLCMVAGAIANLCGNGFPDKHHMRLRSEGGIKALLGMVRSRHPDVISQVARGISNFAKCESQASVQGSKSGRVLF